jgi:hypothetical protein
MNKTEIAIQKQIATAIAHKLSSGRFIAFAERHEAEAASMTYGNKGASTREANRCRRVAAALKEAGL